MKEINLSNSDLKFIVDDEFYDKVIQHTWYLEKSRSKYYPRSRIKGKLIRIHRFLTGITNSYIEVDHLDGNTLNNLLNNLRVCSRSENLRNVGKISRKCTSDYKGVVLIPSNKYRKWGVYVNTKYYGAYHTELEAAKVHDKIAKEVYGEHAYLNFSETKHE